MTIWQKLFGPKTSTGRQRGPGSPAQRSESVFEGKVARVSQESSEFQRQISHLLIDSPLPLQITKRLSDTELKELIDATSQSTWDAISSNLGDVVSNRKEMATADPSGPRIVFEMTVPRDQETRVRREVQSLWSSLMARIQGEGVNSFLRDYGATREGTKPAAATTEPNVSYRIMSGEEAKRTAKAIRPLDFKDGNDYAVAVISFDAPVASFKMLNILGSVQCARCGSPLSFKCKCIGSSSGSNSQSCPQCKKPIYISAGLLDFTDANCKQLYVNAGMTDHLRTEPVKSLIVDSVKQVPL